MGFRNYLNPIILFCGRFVVRGGGLLLAPLLFKIFGHVAVVDADHQCHGFLEQGEADDHDDGAEHIVLPMAEVVADEVGYEQDADNQFEPSRCCAWGVEVWHAEKADAHGVDDAFDNAEGGHGHGEHRHVVEDERDDAQQEQQDAGGNAAGTLQLVADLCLYQLGYEVDESAWVVGFFPLVKDEKEGVDDHQLLDGGQFAQHGRTDDKCHG